MKAVLQVVREASVTADGKDRGMIERGLVILLGVMAGDTTADAEKLAAKIIRLRIFPDEAGKMNRSVSDIGGQTVIVSNFTLSANYKRGNRPDFLGAEKPDTAAPLYDFFVSRFREAGFAPVTGIFGAEMQIRMTADGPCTICMDTKEF